jgi:putative aminopeptidase FrvX
VVLILDKTSQINLIKEFADEYSVPGFEQAMVKRFLSYAKKYGQTEVDGLFNAYVARHENNGQKPLVQLDAHSDSVGFIVQAVRPNGLIKFATLGGWVPTNIPATKVVIKNKEGKHIKGVVATKPPHFMTKEELNQVPVIAEMSIDVGSSSRQETIDEYKIDTGCPIFVDATCEYFEQTGLFLGKDFDNRLGAAALIDVLDQLQGQNLAVDVTAALSSQEEVGLRGAHVTARKLNPDLAIVFEGCPCDDTFTPDWLAQTGLKRGPMLRDLDTTFIANPIFEEFAANLADKLNIPYTRSVRTGGGMNGAAIAYWNGAPTIVLGIPVRYEHTAYNWAALSDYQNAVKIAVNVLKELDEKTIASFKLAD